MRRLLKITVAVGACAVAGLQCTGNAAAEQKEVVIGGTCDRTGPTQINGVGICPGIQDYYDLVNSKGGIDGYRIKYMEIDHEYKVPQGVEAYEREKRDGGLDDGLWDSAGSGAESKADRRQDPGDLTWLRHCRLGGRQTLSLSVPGRRDLLVAGRRGNPVRQGETGRQSRRQEDRLRLLRQPRGPRAAAGHRGSPTARKI